MQIKKRPPNKKQNDSLKVKWLFAIKKSKSILPFFYMLPTGQKQNRKNKKRKGKREREKSKGKT
jgi:hypothetical protein